MQFDKEKFYYGASPFRAKKWLMSYLALHDIILKNFINECDEAESLLCIRMKGLNTQGKEREDGR